MAEEQAEPCEFYKHDLIGHTVSGLCPQKCRSCRRGLLKNEKFIGCRPCRISVCMNCVITKYQCINVEALEFSSDCKEFIPLEDYKFFLGNFEREHFAEDILTNLEKHVLENLEDIEQGNILCGDPTLDDKEQQKLERELYELRMERIHMQEILDFRKIYQERHLKEYSAVEGEPYGVQFKYGMKIGGETITIYSSEATLHTYNCCDVSDLPTFVRNDDNKRVEIKLQVGDSIVYSRRDKGKCKGSGYNGENRLRIRSVPYYFL